MLLPTITTPLLTLPAAPSHPLLPVPHPRSWCRCLQWLLVLFFHHAYSFFSSYLCPHTHMGTSLDIGPVVQLLGSLSSPSAEPSPPTLPASVSVLLPNSEPVPSCTSERRRLGDFSALWSYLATEYAGSHGGNAVADRPTSSRIPESESLTDPPAAKTSKRETVKTVQFLNRDGISKSLPTDLLLQTSSPAKKSQPKQPLPPSPKKTKASENVKSTVLRNFKTNTLQNYNFVSPPESLTKTKPTIRSTIPQEQRKLALVQKLLNYFPENKSTLLQPRPDYTRTGDDIHVFVDNSNVSSVRSSR